MPRALTLPTSYGCIYLPICHSVSNASIYHVEMDIPQLRALSASFRIKKKNPVPQIIYFIGDSSAFFRDFAYIFLQFLYFQMTLIWNSSLTGKMGWIFVLLMVKHRDGTHRRL